MNIAVLWSKIYQDIKDLFGEDLDEIRMLRKANIVIDTLKMLNLPSQIRTDFVSYVYQFERYKLPTDYKTEGIIDLRYDDQIDNDRNRVYMRDEPPFLNYNNSWSFHTPREWNSRCQTDMASIQNNKGIEKLYLANGRGDQIKDEISTCEDISVWTGASGAGNITVDDVVKAEGNYSINYDLTSATAATMTLTLTAVDLSEYVNQGIIRLFKWLPTAPTSIEIRIGSSASDYYTQTITTQADGEVFDEIQLNELEFSFHDATITGSPDMTAVDYFQIILNFAIATTDTDFRIDNITAWKPEQLVLEYYSFYMVLNSSSAWVEYLSETAGVDQSINILPEWRRLFGIGIILDDLLKNEDKRYPVLKTEYDKWIEMLPRRYPNRGKRIGNNYY